MEVMEELGVAKLGGAKLKAKFFRAPCCRTVGTGRRNGSALSKHADHRSQQGSGPGDGRADSEGQHSSEKADRLLQRPKWTKG